MLHEFVSFAAVVINESIDNCMVERFKHYLSLFLRQDTLYRLSYSEIKYQIIYIK